MHILSVPKMHLKMDFGHYRIGINKHKLQSILIVLIAKKIHCLLNKFKLAR